MAVIYISFIRPLFEYGDLIWDNCTLPDTIELIKIQNKAVKIVTGTFALVSLQALYSEVRRESLQTRGTNHKLTLRFRMQHDLVSFYLFNIFPASISEYLRYNFRNVDVYIIISCRT